MKGGTQRRGSHNEWGRDVLFVKAVLQPSDKDLVEQRAEGNL